MKKFITSIFVTTILAAMSFGAEEVPFFISVSNKPVEAVGYVPMSTNLENPTAKAVYDFCKAFTETGQATGFTREMMFSFYNDETLKKFGIDRAAVEKAVKETILANDKQVILSGNYSFGRYFVFTKEGAEFFNSLSPADQKKLAYAVNEKSLLCGLSKNNRYTGDMPEFTVHIDKADLTNAKILAILGFASTDCLNYVWYPPLKAFMDNNGIAEIDYINAIMSYVTGKGNYSKVFQEIFLNKYLPSKTKAEKVKILEVEIEGLLPTFDPDNAEQNKWLTKLRITKTIYAE